MNWYLDSPELLIGGFICIVIGAFVGAVMSSMTGRVIGGVFFVVGVLAVLYSFAGPDLRPLQFIAACVFVGFVGFNIFNSDFRGARVVGAAIIAFVVFALLNTAVRPLNIPLLDQDYSENVGRAFKTAGEVFSEIFDRATQNDPRPRRQEPIP